MERGASRADPLTKRRFRAGAGARLARSPFSRSRDRRQLASPPPEPILGGGVPTKLTVRRLFIFSQSSRSRTSSAAIARLMKTAAATQP
jgi:hypothetical protein